MTTKTILIIAISILFNLNQTDNIMQTQNETMDTITVNGGNAKIQVIDQGKGENTLLFLHGWCIDGSYWQEQLVHFSKNYRVVIVDLPGFGKSSANRESWTMESFADDVMGVIDQLDLQNIVLIGHSMSGAVVLETALKHDKVVAAVGVDNFKTVAQQFSEEQMAQWNASMQQLSTDFKNAAPMYAEYMLFSPETPQEVKDRVKQDYGNADPAIGNSTLQALIQYSMTEAEKLKQLETKLYLIHSDYTPTYMPGLEECCADNYEILTIKGVGHFPMIEKPQEFNKVLDEVLNRI